MQSYTDRGKRTKPREGTETQRNSRYHTSSLVGKRTKPREGTETVTCNFNIFINVEKELNPVRGRKQLCLKSY